MLGIQKRPPSRRPRVGATTFAPGTPVANAATKCRAMASSCGVSPGNAIRCPPVAATSRARFADLAPGTCCTSSVPRRPFSQAGQDAALGLGEVRLTWGHPSIPFHSPTRPALGPCNRPAVLPDRPCPLSNAFSAAPGTAPNEPSLCRSGPAYRRRVHLGLDVTEPSRDLGPGGDPHGAEGRSGRRWCGSGGIGRTA